MIDVGSFRSRDCYGISRRAFVRAGMTLPLAAGAGRPAEANVTAPAGPARSKAYLNTIIVVYIGFRVYNSNVTFGGSC